MAQQLLIIGNGMASVRLVEALLKKAPDRFAITIVGAEPRPAYNRVLLSALLAQDVSETDIIMRPTDWYGAQDIRLITGDAVMHLDVQAKDATLASGLRLRFDHCVIATGSTAVRLPIPGMDKPGVITFRDLDDVATMDQTIARKQSVAVIGGGLLGIEAAYGLAKRGAKVTLVHVMDRLMERQIDKRAASLLKRALERRGIKVMLQAQTVAVIGDGQASGLAFADGSMLAADLVVCAVGIRPNDALAGAAGIATNRGIIVNDAMTSSLPFIHAIGECAQHRGIAYGLVEPAYAQAEVLAANLAGDTVCFDGMVLATNLKVSGVPVFSAGDFMGTDGTQCVHVEDRYRGHYRKLVFRGGRLVGCLLVGEAEDGLWYLALIRDAVDISAVRHALIHGRDFAEPLIKEAA